MGSLGDADLLPFLFDLNFIHRALGEKLHELPDVV
jgi:hypothetical protein